MTIPSWLTLEEAVQLIRQGRGAGMKIAVLDSGVETAHPDLRQARFTDDIAITEDGVTVTVGDGEGRDLYGHGTAVASIVARMAPEASIGSFRVLGGRLESRTVIIREGVRQAMDRGYHILNCSFGCRGVETFVMAYKQWIDEAYLKGVHVVAACNNDDFSIPEWPGFFPTVITVNMSTTRDSETFYHRAGTLVEFAAPGVEVDVAWKDSTQKSVTGSSFAAPHVSSLLARLLSQRPCLSPLLAKAVLRQVAQPWRTEMGGRNERA
jgi:subtilisin